jgi:hypothetical protein
LTVADRPSAAALRAHPFEAPERRIAFIARCRLHCVQVEAVRASLGWQTFPIVGGRCPAIAVEVVLAAAAIRGYSGFGFSMITVVSLCQVIPRPISFPSSCYSKSPPVILFAEYVKYQGQSAVADQPTSSTAFTPTLNGLYGD